MQNGTEQARDAVSRLFEAYGDGVYQYVRYSLSNPVEAEDITQDVFLEALRSWSNFRGGSSEKTWLWSIARHRIQDRLRQRGREGVSAELDEDALPGGVAADTDTRLDLERALRQLSIDQRQVFTLRIIQDKPAAEVASILGWSNVKVRVTLHRALKALESLLQVGPPLAEEGGYRGR